MDAQVDELVETLRQSLAAEGLGAPLKFDLGPDGVLWINGSEVCRKDAPADTVLTTTTEVLAAICAGRTDPVQAYYQGRLHLSGSQNLAMQLSLLLDAAHGETRRIRRFSIQADFRDVAEALNAAGAAIVENCVTDALADRVAQELRPHFDAVGDAYYADFEGYKTLRLSEILARSRASAELIGRGLHAGRRRSNPIAALHQLPDWQLHRHRNPARRVGPSPASRRRHLSLEHSRHGAAGECHVGAERLH